MFKLWVAGLVLIAELAVPRRGRAQAPRLSHPARCVGRKLGGPERTDHRDSRSRQTGPHQAGAAVTPSPTCPCRREKDQVKPSDIVVPPARRWCAPSSRRRANRFATADPVVYLPDHSYHAAGETDPPTTNHLATSHKFSDRLARGQSSDDPTAKSSDLPPAPNRLPDESVAVIPQPVDDAPDQPPARDAGSSHAGRKRLCREPLDCSHRPRARPFQPRCPACAFAENRPSSHPVKARASGAFESPSLFAVDRSLPHSGDVETNRQRRSRQTDKPTAPDVNAKPSDESAPAAQGVIARTTHDDAADEAGKR